MARTTRITYAQCLVLGSPRPADQDNTNNLTGLKRIQSADVDFAFSRKRFKQIGSTDYVGDINLTNPEISCQLNYFYTNGTNEVMLGLDVDQTRSTLNHLRAPNQDNNYYIIFGTGINNQPLLETNDSNFVNKFNVMGLGNCHLNSYSIEGSTNSLVSVSATIQADNVALEPYNSSAGNPIPAITASTKLPSSNKYKVKKSFFQNTSNQDGLIDSAFAPSGIKLTLPTGNVPGLELSGSAGTAFINAFNLSFDIERVALYGFGSIYPYGRRALMPTLGNLSFSAVASEFRDGNLYDLVKLDNNEEVEMDFQIDLVNTSGTTGLQINIDRAKFDSQSFSESINDFGQIDCQLSFSISDVTGLRFSTPPLILAQPEDASGPSGPLNIIATGHSPLSYKWYDTDGPTEVSTSQAYTAPVGDYYCVVSNDLGSATSNTVSVV